MANKYIKEMMKWEGAVKRDYNPFNHVLRTRSPSVNFTFGRTHGLPEGYSMVIFGEPKAGKTVLVNEFTGALHQSDPDAIVVKFDTELREELQNSELSMETGGDAGSHNLSLWGIDPDRYVAFSVNTPKLVFDRIETEIPAMIQDGAKIKLVVIDSINAIQGKRQVGQDSIMDNSIGDLAITLQEGFKRILAAQRKHKFSVIVTAHVRAELDRTQQMKTGSNIKMGASYGVKHYGEYFMFVERLTNKDSQKDALGNPFEDASKVDMLEKKERYAQKHRVCMRGNSATGTAQGRVGEFTFDFAKGIVNQHEELYDLGVGRGIIAKKSNIAHVLAGKTFKGREAMLLALRDDAELRKAVQDGLLQQDTIGTVGNRVAAEAVEEPTVDADDSADAA